MRSILVTIALILALLILTLCAAVEEDTSEAGNQVHEDAANTAELISN